MTIKGRIFTINETQLLGANNYPKRTIMLDRTRKDDFSDKTYPNFNEITFLGEKNTKLIEGYQIGDIIECTVESVGNFFDYNNEKKFSQEIQCRDIKLIRKAEPQNQAANENPSVYNQK